MGGKSSADNSAVVDEQKAQAAEEAAKEADRQQRLTTGLASIKQAFEGSPVMASQTTPYDWSTFKAPGFDRTTMQSSTGSAPAGYTAVQVAPKSGGTATDPYARTRAVANLNANTNAVQNQSYGQTGGGRNQYASDYAPEPAGATTATSAAAPVWALKDASGKLYYQGDPLNVTSTYDTGQTSGGFDDAFYNKYKQSVLDYYMPQVQDQYKKAQEQATYGLGRSGNLRSSAANTLVADLAKQNAINEAGVRNQADTAAGDLSSQVSSERSKATSQLYATEDPEVASQQALAAVRDISLKQPDLSPLSALFNVATIGAANINKGYQAQQNLNAFSGALPKDKSRNVV
jgi:hypothetical protein